MSVARRATPIGPIKAFGPPGVFDPRWCTLLLGEAPNRWMAETGHYYHALWREDLAELCFGDAPDRMLRFLNTFARANLLDFWPGYDDGKRGTREPGTGGGPKRGSKFPTALARPRAEALLKALLAPPLRVRHLVVVGRRTANAFGDVLKGIAFFDCVYASPPGNEVDSLRISVVPHPSGASAWWNDTENRASARLWWETQAAFQREAMGSA